MNNHPAPSRLREMLFVLAWVLLAVLARHFTPTAETSTTALPRIELSAQHTEADSVSRNR